MTPYRQIFVNSFKVAFHNKVLWLLAIFVAILGNSSQLQFIVDTFTTTSDQGTSLWYLKVLQSTGVFSWSIFSNIGQYIMRSPLESIITIILAIIALIVAFFAVKWIIINQAGLIVGIDKVNQNKAVKYKELIQTGKKSFWDLFKNAALAKVLTMLIFFIVGLPSLFVVSSLDNLSGLIIFWFISSFVIFLPIAVIVSLVARLTSIDIVLNGQKFLPALRQSTKMFTKNWLAVLELAMIFFLINFVIAFIYVVVAVLLIAPFIFIGYMFNSLMTSSGPFVIMIGYVFIFFVTLFIGTIYATFQYSAWIDLYKALSGNSLRSKLDRVFRK